MKKIFTIIGIASLAFTSCSKDDTTNDISQQTVIKATFEQDDSSSRLNIADNNSLTWSTGDAFALFGNGSSAKFTLQGEGGSATGTFTGTTPSTILGAAFPYTSETNPSLSGSTLTMTLPAELNQADGKCNLPMWAATNSTENISFKHLAGVLRVELKNIPVGYKSLIVTADKPISGTFTATTTDTTPVLASTSTADADKTLTVSFTAPTEATNSNTLYVPLPVDNYASIKISISNGTTPIELITYTNKNVARAKINKAILTYSSATGTLATPVANPTELVNALTTGKSVILTDDIELSAALTIAATNNVAIDLNNNTLTTASTANADAEIIVEGKLNIINGTITSNSTALYAIGSGELKLDNCTINGTNPEAAAVAASGANAKLEASNCTTNAANSAFYAFGGAKMTLTNCTVSKSEATTTALVAISGNNSVLTIDGGSYTGKEVTTAYDKYVIGVIKGASATINTTVSGGNGGVSVISGSTANLTGGSYSGVKACGLYVAGGSTVTYSNCSFSGAEGDVVVGGGEYGAGTVNGNTYDVYTKIQQLSTTDNIEDIISNGGYVTLAPNSNVSLSEALTIAATNNITIDLNNNTLTTASTANADAEIIVEGKLNIINGTITSNSTALYAIGSGELKLDNCTINGTNPEAAAVAASGANAKLEASNCTTNAANSAFYAFGGAKMTLTNCTVSKSEATTTALVAISGNNSVLTIDGGSYTGKEVTTAYDKYVIGVIKGASATINTTVSGGNGGVSVISGSTANLTGGSYSGVKACGLYVAGGSTVTYSNCSFSGAEGNVVVGGGEYGAGTVNGNTYNVYTKVE